MDKAELQKIAGIVSEGYGYNPATEEAINAVKSAVADLFDRLLSDERMADMQARDVVNRILKSQM